MALPFRRVCGGGGCVPGSEVWGVGMRGMGMGMLELRQETGLAGTPATPMGSKGREGWGG